MVQLESSLSELPARLRARILEVLELYTDEAALRRLRKSTTVRDVGAELFNLWGDWYAPKGKDFRKAFSPAELAALVRFNRVLDDVAAKTPDPLPPVDVLVRSPEWQRLAAAARSALEHLQRN